MWQDIFDYFLAPKKTGYDVPKTLIFATLLVIAVYSIYIMLKKLKVKIDKKLALAVSPFVVFGGIIRVLQDAGVLNSFLFVTPSIYFFVFLIVFFSLLVFLFIEKKKKIPYFKPLFILGLILISFSIPYLKPVNFYGSLQAVVFFLPWLIIFYLLKWSPSNKIVTLVQLFDATTTFVALNFFGRSDLGYMGFIEQHVVPTFFINIFGPFSFVIIKLIVIVSVLLLIDKFSDEKEFNDYLKVIMGILGGATGSRDFIALLTLTA